LKKENAVSIVFLFGLFNRPNWELGNPSHLALSCTHAAAMMSPKTVELKQGAEEPPMEEAKRCELKLPIHSGHEKPRTENRTEVTENRTEVTEPIGFGS
jgi:hypothetical protein